jgi:hypothetical protein
MANGWAQERRATRALLRVVARLLREMAA